MRRQADNLAAPLAELAARLAGRPPDVVVTCARGSSAHAATFAKHLIERHVGIPVAAAAPNIATIYRRPLRLRGQLFLTISQSGSSDDLIEMTSAARAAGALTVAHRQRCRRVPWPPSSEIVLPMAAGPELSVAATKTFIASLAAVLRLAAQWAGSDKMLRACERLPDRLDEAARSRLERALQSVGACELVLLRSAAGRRWRSPARRHSSSRKPARCTPRRSAAPNSAMVRSHWFRAPTPCLYSRRPTNPPGTFGDLVGDLRRKGA